MGGGDRYRYSTFDVGGREDDSGDGFQGQIGRMHQR